MNALILFFAWLAAILGGGDPCGNHTYAQANAETCGETTAVVERHFTPSITDISNGF